MRINLPLWIVRLTLGISFFLHGWGKFPYPPEKFAAWLESIGMVIPMTIATLVVIIIIEFHDVFNPSMLNNNDSVVSIIFIFLKYNNIVKRKIR